MKFYQFKEAVDHYTALQSQYNDYSDSEVVIPVYRAGCVGGQPFISLKNITAGFDWDSGKIFLTPEKQLRVIEEDEVKKLRKDVDDMSYTIYKFRSLQSENEKLKDEIKKLKAGSENVKHTDRNT